MTIYFIIYDEYFPTHVHKSLILFMITRGTVHALYHCMQWLEEIRVRTQPRKEKQVMDLLLEAATSASRNKEVRAARVYSHHSSPAGFSLILFWETPSIPAQGSETAQFILEGFKSLGLLDHSVLIEAKKERKNKKRSGGPEKLRRTQ